MNWLERIKLLTKIQLFISLLFIFMYLASWAFIYIERKKQISDESFEKYNKQLNELESIIDIYLRRDRDILNVAANMAEYKINEYSDIEESEERIITIKAVDPFNNQSIDVKINDWTVDGYPLLGNNLLVDELFKLTKLDVSIYQKCDKGYVNVSTNIRSLTGERLTGDIILNSSPIIKSVEQGNQFSGRINQSNAWFLANYKPIYVNGKIRGIYYLGIRERIGRALKEIFEERKYFKEGFPFLISKEGIMLIHPEKQGENYTATSLYKKLIENKNISGQFQYRWPDNRKGKMWNLHFRYHESTNSYICISYPVNLLYWELTLQSIYASIGFVLFFILLQMIFAFSFKALRKRLRKLRTSLGQLAEGRKPSKLEIHGEKDFAILSERINQISDRFGDLANFAYGLANDNFSQTYPKSFINDTLGEALIKINDKLNEAMYNENIRQKEDKLRVWESEGLSKFVNILQRNRENLEELCYELISNLVDYLNADLGALFFINSDNPDDVYFEQMATYAFEQQKLIQKKIYPEQGLIGRIFSEKETIYLAEIPDDYITIVSGLGKGSPKNLLIVPLLINKEVYGAIEIASFNVIKGFQIEFIEKIGENIASTINNVLVNNKTWRLLEQSRQQSELLSNQEEEMKRNILELQNIQKETGASQYTMKDVYKSLEQVLLLVELKGDGEILSINDPVTTFFAMMKKSLIGKHYSDYSHFIPVDEYKNLIRCWDKINKNEKVQTELKVKSGLGKTTNILVNFIPEFENEILQRVIIMGVELKN